MSVVDYLPLPTAKAIEIDADQTGEVLLVETVRNTGSHQAIMISCLCVSLGGSCESESA
ncbi:hypothetical protein AB0E04_43680 [Streptomyces sp. NPDC048251]|uniref:hypothetical protein n=1 Tax=Streptomyces sp. NPDC048251 TaxID=3154501 RepID=UPI00343C576A